MSDDTPLKPQPTPEYQELSNTASRFGPRLVQMPQGVVLIEDAPGFTTALVDHPEPSQRRVAVIVYDPDNDGGVGRGFISQLPADSARVLAASLMRLAAQLDPGAPN
ncbi:hypothetical protein [Sphingopyxis flava]|uniref:Uncharacterized protein n=1 Tax=Sphingopyxis flava TaxID=1507287 RepID=A0A1T5AD35_9SPHN|nr:hypothetical protein [Sphingopyxis flava]SKB32836.1 hypothetical protein SAMN06295937_1003116 [Sphingopyxis flava]